MVGSQCCENPPDLSLSSGGGCVEEIGGLESYISGSLDSKLGILLVSDVFGFEAPNLRKLADKVAATGYYVVAPNFFHGDPFTPEKNLMYWYQFHLAEDAAAEARPVIEALRSKGITAIGAAGICWGAKVLVELSKLDELKAIVMLHPSLVTVDDIQDIKVPISILGAEIDQMSPPEVLKEFEEVLSTKAEVDSFVKIFNGVRHGWSVRYNIKNEEAVKRAEEAHNDMLEWFFKKLADKVAAAGYYVVAPNFFHGDPFTPEKNLMYWYQFHLAEDAAAEARPVIEALRSKGITAIGAAGICWGAKVLVELSKLDELKAIVMLHPSLVTVDDIQDIKVPISILGAEIDQMSPPEVLNEFEEVLSTKAEVDSSVKIFNGVRHGWTVRYNIKNVEAVKRAEEAHNDMLEWFFKYVKSSCCCRRSAL